MRCTGAVHEVCSSHGFNVSDAESELYSGGSSLVSDAFSGGTACVTSRIQEAEFIRRRLLQDPEFATAENDWPGHGLEIEPRDHRLARPPRPQHLGPGSCSQLTVACLAYASLPTRDRTGDVCLGGTRRQTKQRTQFRNGAHPSGDDATPSDLTGEDAVGRHR